ncbi:MULTISPECIES: hypothetical protein [Acinetobacter]|uniref:hypothetical protein n=1 Tax=Acinetobacter TaxID=469 RepID=UPI000CF1CFAB|nr:MULTISPECIES: hypothetical protein [Acinetobacter]AVH48896.1 hypothetical protein C3Y93_04215 [Acinetobacter sp. SWBY1]MBF4521594.1 hypothetical protein [Acinetobacter towneri]MDM1487099.1 hypothetical protein [Acinetobacter towneri]
MKPLVYGALLTVLGLVACREEPKVQQVDPQKYQVQDAVALQQRIDALNTKLAQDFKQFKQVESIAFSHQFPLDVNNLRSLNQHLVSSTALKPTKIAYCDMMNGYFSELYRLGHYNLALLKDVQLPQAEKENLPANFASPEAYYDFILNRYTSYRQVQQTMGYGCNLKAAL